MNLLFDISLLGRSTLGPIYQSGLSRVTEELGKRLIESDLCDLTLFATRHRSEAESYARITSPFDSCPFDCAVRGDRYDVFHTPFYSPAEEIRNPESDIDVVFQTFHDLIPILLPDMCTRVQRAAARERLDAISDNDWVLAVSEATKADLCEHRNLDPERVFVTHCAADPARFYPCSDHRKRAEVKRKYRIPEEARYLLSLSSLSPHKNLRHAVRCFAEVVANEPQADGLHLVLAGHPGWRAREILDEILALAPHHRARILVTGFVDDDDLAALYSAADAFLFPSFYEGFGLPPLEAMQCGTPVIASRTSSLPEVVGEAGILVDPRDRDSLCQAIVDVVASRSLRDELSRRAQAQAARFSWERCAEETVSAYATACEAVRAGV